MRILKGLIGVTLIELMITTFIVVITSIIIANVYLTYERKERRSDIVSAINSIVQAEEGYHSYHSKYALLTEMSNQKIKIEKKYHFVAISNVSAATYTVIAIAVGDQVNDVVKGTSCALMQLKKTNDLIIKTPAACWSL